MQPIQYAIEDVCIDLIKRNPDNARSGRDEARLIDLANDLKTKGQIYPLIGYRDGSSVPLVDGHSRLEAGLIAGLLKLKVLICDRPPTRTEALQLQARIDAHRHNFNAVELSDLLAKLQAETKATVTELAQQINKSQSFCTKLLALQRISAGVRDQVKSGTLDVERAYVIASAESDPAKQTELAAKAVTLSREQLRQHVKQPNRTEAKLSSARLSMPGGMMVDVRGNALTLPCVIEVLTETLRILKKGLASGWDLSTQCQVLRDQSKQLPKSALSK